jgi:ATP synthase subunit 6
MGIPEEVGYGVVALVCASAGFFFADYKHADTIAAIKKAGAVVRELEAQLAKNALLQKYESDMLDLVRNDLHILRSTKVLTPLEEQLNRQILEAIIKSAEQLEVADVLSEGTLKTQDPLEQFTVPADETPYGVLPYALLFVGVVGTLVLIYAISGKNWTFPVVSAVVNNVKSVVKENIQTWRQPYFLPVFYLFIFILAANVYGLFPFTFTNSSALAVTFFLALTFFLKINLLAVFLGRWTAFGAFLPAGAPLEIAVLLVLIESISYVARVFSLSIRLFANMLSGHALLKILLGFVRKMIVPLSALTLLAVIPWTVVTAVLGLETVIAFLQAHVFIVLISLYLNEAVSGAH